jgi:hypothetical protein
MTTAGTAIRTARTAKDGRNALRGRGLDTALASPEKNETKALSSARSLNTSVTIAQPPGQVWTRKYFFRETRFLFMWLFECQRERSDRQPCHICHAATVNPDEATDVRM